MSFQDKRPPILVKIDINRFNILMNILDDVKSEDSDYFKDKFLKYGFVKDDEVYIGFYPREVKVILPILLDNLKPNIKINYYLKLLNKK